MNPISKSNSDTNSFVTYKQNRPNIILGSICVLAGILLGSELLREPPAVSLPLYNKTIIPVPTQEMNKLSESLKTTETRCQRRYVSFNDQEQRVNSLYHGMHAKEWAIFNTPEFIRPFLGNAVGADLETIQTYSNALTNSEKLKLSLIQCQTQLQVINERVANLQNWAKAEGDLITHREAIQAMSGVISQYDHALEDSWKTFKHIDKLNYYVPTEYFANPLVENSLKSAVSYTELVNFWSRIDRFSLHLFHNIAESLAYFNILNELTTIAKKAQFVNDQLEELIMDVFKSERLLYAQKNNLIVADTSTVEAQESLRKYLNNWADPGIFERL